MIAGGLSVLASEFPAAQKVLDKGKKKMRDFAEHDQHIMKEDELGLGFEIVDDPKRERSLASPTGRAKISIDMVRTVTRENILPLIDRLPSRQAQAPQKELKEQSEEKESEEQKESYEEENIHPQQPQTKINSCYEMYNSLSR